MDSYTSIVLLPSGKMVNTAQIAWATPRYDEHDMLVEVTFYKGDSRQILMSKEDAIDLYLYLSIFALDVGSHIGR